MQIPINPGSRRRWIALYSIALVFGFMGLVRSGGDVFGRVELDSVEARRAHILNEVANRPPATDCPLQARCDWFGLARILASYAGGGRSPSSQLDIELRSLASNLPGREGWKRMRDPRDSTPSRPLDPAWDFPFVTATLLFRIERMYGQGTASGRRLLTSETQRTVAAVFHEWTSSECSLSEADIGNVWRPWSSENHDLQRAHTCLAGAELAASNATNVEMKYADGSTTAEQLAKWTAYFKIYIKSRGRNGVSVEYFSPTYAKYFLGPLYNIRDFASDKELRKLADNIITLWWALWAQEQIDGHHGGSKTRTYPKEASTGEPSSGLEWLYTGGRIRLGLSHPALLPILTSDYRLPPVVVSIIKGVGRALPYEVWTRQLGAAGTGSRAGHRAPLAPSAEAIARYSYVAPGFIMGSALVEPKRADYWTTTSSQNRWNGVALTSGTDARIYTLVLPAAGRSSYNAVLAAQNKGTQIVQRLPAPFSRHAGDMAICIGRSLKPIVQDGWVFVEDSARVAVRPAFGGFGAWLDDHCIALGDSRSPVVMQASPLSDHRDLAAFRTAILSIRIEVRENAVIVEGLGSDGELRLALDQPPARALPSDAILKSAFIRQSASQGRVEIEIAGDRMMLDFD